MNILPIIQWPVDSNTTCTTVYMPFNGRENVHNSILRIGDIMNGPILWRDEPATE